MSESLERLVRNQALFREVNERISEVVDHRAAPTEFVCECSRPECTTAIMLTIEEYERVRSDPTHFFVAPGHVTEAVERVVATNGGYKVVEKTHRREIVAADGDG